MRTILLTLTICFSGCTHAAPDSAELSMLKRSLSGVSALASQNDTTHAQLSDQTAKLDRIIQQLDASPEDLVPLVTTTVDCDCIDCDCDPCVCGVNAVASSGKPKLWITYADFNCPPCDRLRADIASGRLDEFTIVVASGDGIDGSRPAIRFLSPTSQTGYAVQYGYSETMLRWLKSNLLDVQAEMIVSRPAVTSHSDMVATHNALHGGGSWTWPGDLATHLRETHGVNSGSQSQPVRYSNTSSCPGGVCPTRSRRGLFGRRR